MFTRVKGFVSLLRGRMPHTPPGNPHPLYPTLTLRQRRTLRRRVFHFQLGARPGASSTSSTLRAFKGEGDIRTEGRMGAQHPCVPLVQYWGEGDGFTPEAHLRLGWGREWGEAKPASLEVTPLRRRGCGLCPLPSGPGRRTSSGRRARSRYLAGLDPS